MTDRLGDLKDGEPDVEMGGGIGSEAMGTEMLKKFNREAQAIDGALDKINSSVAFLEEEASAGQYDHAKAQHVLSQCKSKCEAVRTRLKRIADENKTMKESVLAGNEEYSPGEVHIRIQQSQMLAEKFRDTTGALELGEEKEKDRSTQAIYDEIRELNPNASDAEIKAAVQSNDFTGVLGAEQVQLQRSELAQRVGELQERNGALKELEKDVVQLHQMFMDMAILVENQGELLNQIDYNVTKTKNDAHVAVEEIEDARRLQLSARKKKICIVVIILLIALGILFAIIGPMIPGWINN